jgi:hypothetical protein
MVSKEIRAKEVRTIKQAINVSTIYSAFMPIWVDIS